MGVVVAPWENHTGCRCGRACTGGDHTSPLAATQYTTTPSGMAHTAGPHQITGTNTEISNYFHWQILDWLGNWNFSSYEICPDKVDSRKGCCQH